MLDSIYIGMSGLMGYSLGLRVIANNTANINTPGFKGSSMQFGDLVYSASASGTAYRDGGTLQLGQGLATYSTSLDFSQGDLRQTGDDLDLAIDGQGLFTLKDADGRLAYSRDGEFKFDDDGFLVSRTNGDRVQARNDSGTLVPVSLANLRSNPAKATSTLTFRGNLSNDGSQDDNVHTLSDVTVHDKVGGKHSLTLAFRRLASTQPSQVRWSVTASEGGTTIGTGELLFVGGLLDPTTAKLHMAYQPAGMASMPLTLDFGADVTSNAAGSQSDLKMTTQDGYPSGPLTQVGFDADGVLNLTYANGQTTEGVRLALARFNSPDGVRAVGDNLFEPVDESQWEWGAAGSGAFGTLQSGVVEISNVDLSSEFSDLVIMQRGYQASSQVVSTANEMIQELFSLNRR